MRAVPEPRSSTSTETGAPAVKLEAQVLLSMYQSVCPPALRRILVPPLPTSTVLTVSRSRPAQLPAGTVPGGHAGAAANAAACAAYRFAQLILNEPSTIAPTNRTADMTRVARMPFAFFALS